VSNSTDRAPSWDSFGLLPPPPQEESANAALKASSRQNAILILDNFKQSLKHLGAIFVIFCQKTQLSFNFALTLTKNYENRAKIT